MRKKMIILITILMVISLSIVFCVNKENTVTVAKVNSNTYKILVDVEESRLYLFENNEIVKVYKCAGGKPSTPSPIGTWKIVHKANWGEGFGGSWMGFNVPWGQFGIHGTLDKYSIGWSSSHGCIRMNNEDVAELYKIIPYGTQVTIVDGVYGAFGKGFRSLKSGMYGSDVFEIQKRLKELGFLNASPNGKFGGATEEAIRNFCRGNKLYETKIITPDLIQKMGFVLID